MAQPSQKTYESMNTAINDVLWHDDMIDVYKSKQETI